MAVLFFLTLPGSLALLLIGIVAAFSGEIGEQIAAVRVVISVANAHLVGMIYYCGLKQDRNKNVDTPQP